MQKEELLKITGHEQGKLGIFYLKKIWACTMLETINQKDPEYFTQHNYVSAVFDALGIGIEPTYKYLYNKSNSFEDFEEWILKYGIPSEEMIAMFNNAYLNKKEEKEEEPIENILNEEDLKKWEENGYIIVKNVISKEDCETTIDAIADVLRMDTNNSNTWYNFHPLKQGIMVQLFNQEQLNKNRLSPKIKSAFQQLWKQNHVLPSMDRVSFNPPETDFYRFPGPKLHWDVSLKQPIPFGVQGLLYLSDTTEEQGAFTLVPGFHKKINNWLEKLPEYYNPRTEDLYSLGAKPIAAEAGDLIIWHQALPHGSSPNKGKYPRYVQYITYKPLTYEIQDEWI